MKRAISILCIAVLFASILCLVGCSKNIDGKYEMADYILDGESKMSELGDVTVMLEIKGNTAALTGMGDSIGDIEETYTVNAEKKVLTDDTGQEITYRAEGGRITLENGGISMVFEKR